MNTFITPILLTFCLLSSQAQEVQNRLLEFLEVGKFVDAEFIKVVSDPSMEPYGKLVEAARKKDPKWFAEHEKKGKPGTPIPYHEKLMSKDQYEGYMKAWDVRKILPVKGKNGKPLRLKIILTEEADGKYIINVPEVPISLLEYSAQTDSFSSMFGELKFLEPVEASALSSLRAWTGYEWKAEKKDVVDTTKQNFAIGRTADGKFGYLIYRISQVAGKKITVDRRFVLRFVTEKMKKK